MLPEFNHNAIQKAAARAGFTRGMLAELCRIPVTSVEAIFAGSRDGAELLELLRVAGTLRLTMLETFPWAKPSPPPGMVDFEILVGNRERRFFRLVEAYPASNGRRESRNETAPEVCAAVGGHV